MASGRVSAARNSEAGIPVASEALATMARSLAPSAITSRDPDREAGSSISRNAARGSMRVCKV
ncbi:unannotated protein [freshwater metagenome]|uniref:Unannotated protein n=1 Tax=freshwater metagenome TaxID=449393 RepID=A0A6J7L8A1_9ZZZZ